MCNKNGMKISIINIHVKVCTGGYPLDWAFPMEKSEIMEYLESTQNYGCMGIKERASRFFLCNFVNSANLLAPNTPSYNLYNVHVIVLLTIK